MFTDSDFEIDEEFLNDVFDNKDINVEDAPSENLLVNNNIFRNVNNPTMSKLGIHANASTNESTLEVQDTSTRMPIIEFHKKIEHSRSHTKLTVFTKPTSSKQSPVVALSEPSTSTVTPKASHFGGRIQIRHRKFPGPAGLLPDKYEKLVNRSLDTSLLNTSNITANENTTINSEAIICSQNTNFNEGPWLRLSSDYDLSESSQLGSYNVAWIKRRATSRQLLGRKVPFLAAVLKHIDFFSTDPSVVLEDQTGVINGTLHRDVVEEYAGHLKPGSALLLHQMGVVSTGYPTRRHYLNITLNNVITIYDCQEGMSNVRTTKVKDISMGELNRLISKCEEQILNTPVNSPVPDQSPLFSNVSSRNVSTPNPLQTNFNPGFHKSTPFRPYNSPAEVRSKFPQNSTVSASVNVSNFRTSSHKCLTNAPLHSMATSNVTNFNAKVPRLSESATNKSHENDKHLQSVHGVVKSSKNKNETILEDGEKEIVEGIFQGFDCSSLFEDF